MSLLRKIFIPIQNVANYWIKGTFAYKTAAGENLEIFEGAAITTSAAASAVAITTAAAHGLLVGDHVRVFGHVNTATPSATPLIDPEDLYAVLSVPSDTTLTINLTTTEAGARGYIGKATGDYIVAADAVGVMYGAFTDFSPQEDRVG